MIGFPHSEGAAIMRRPSPSIANHLTRPMGGHFRGDTMTDSIYSDLLRHAEVDARRADSWATDPTRYDDNDKEDDDD